MNKSKTQWRRASVRAASVAERSSADLRARENAMSQGENPPAVIATRFQEVVSGNTRMR